MHWTHQQLKTKPQGGEFFSQFLRRTKYEQKAFSRRRREPKVAKMFAPRNEIIDESTRLTFFFQEQWLNELHDNVLVVDVYS